MSFTYTCDRCRHQETYRDGFVGNEFSHYGQNHRLKDKFKGRRQMHTLAVSLPGGVKDVCDNCFKEIVAAKSDAEREVKKTVTARWYEKLGL